ncbi:hypothetical protein K491DRAFT_313623 [Lophiostoma macrostomum CBS 122681]|uniref:Cytochrome c oxidase assembly factor 3 n=1 Tax=Lophiostoma macrostomum CBS 122681 TaxID=1314788 RepID=A0A6A6SLW4_9PLEO|nr:hypothetical protein K491DRAFT_313623 [Lophiostoma macrostomum CBS 122681]
MVYRPFQSTYYDARMQAQPALLRARAPYLVKNTITGATIVGIVIGISISQDEFEDVIVPEEPLKRPQAPSATESVRQAVEARK